MAASPTDPDAEQVGRVVEFHEAAGLGSIEASGRAYPFQCVEILDGTRTIAVGARVAFDVRPRLGRYEAVRIRSV